MLPSVLRMQPEQSRYFGMVLFFFAGLGDFSIPGHFLDVAGGGHVNQD